MNNIPFSFFRENRFFVLSVIVFTVSFVALIALTFGISFMANELQEAKQQNMFTHDELASDQYTRLVRTMSLIEEEYKSMSELMVQKNNLIPFVRQLELAAGTSNLILTIETVSTSTAKDQAQYSLPVVRYRLKASGSVENVAEYLSVLHSLSPLVHVEQVSMSSKDEENFMERTEAEITIVAPVEENV